MCMCLYGCGSYLQCVAGFTAERHHLVDHVPVPCFDAVGWHHRLRTGSQTNSYGLGVGGGVTTECVWVSIYPVIKVSV